MAPWTASRQAVRERHIALDLNSPIEFWVSSEDPYFESINRNVQKSSHHVSFSTEDQDFFYSSCICAGREGESHDQKRLSWRGPSDRGIHRPTKAMYPEVTSSTARVSRKSYSSAQILANYYFLAPTHIFLFVF